MPVRKAEAPPAGASESPRRSARLAPASPFTKGLNPDTGKVYPKAPQGLFDWRVSIVVPLTTILLMMLLLLVTMLVDVSLSVQRSFVAFVLFTNTLA